MKMSHMMSEGKSSMLRIAMGVFCVKWQMDKIERNKNEKEQCRVILRLSHARCMIP